MGLSLRAASLDWKYLKNPFVVITDTAGNTTDLISQHVIMMKESEKILQIAETSLLDELGDIHIPHLCHRYGKCAEGTMTEEDVVLTESSNKKYGMKKMLYLMWKGKNKYYGTKVTINVWEPKIQQQYEFTFSQICLLSDLFRKYLNSIEAGWQVHSVNF
uniref:Neprosin PEP catalytic domain-containing protein n=1 Tax=Brassica oleracea var. oleracea TaxID=109376 RepID=A0A0D3CUR9_BRAOL